MNKTFTLICGGSGASEIIKNLIKLKSLNINIIVNAYDDGKSTGKIRDDFGILGPSDIAKNIINLLDPKKDLNIKKFLSYRFPITSIQKTHSIYEDFIKYKPNGSEFSILYNNLPITIQNVFRIYLTEFYKQATLLTKNRRTPYDLRDYAVRNIIFTGAYFLSRNYQHATDRLLKDLKVKNARILINSEDILYLTGITENGNLLRYEKSIVEDYIFEDIQEIFLLKRKLNIKNIEILKDLKKVTTKINYLTKLNTFPKINPGVKVALSSSDLLIVCPGTLESSLTPTFFTKNFTKYFLSSSAKKVIIPNLIRERGNKSVSEILFRLESIFRNVGYLETTIDQIFDFVIVNNHGYISQSSQLKYIPVDKNRLKEMGLNIIEDRLENQNVSGKHEPHKITKILLKIAKNRNNNLKKLNHTQEIIMNCLNNPFIDIIDKNRIQYLERNIINKESYKKIKENVKVILPMAGLQTRFDGTEPKALFRIVGVPSIIHILNKISNLDPDPILIINKSNISSVKKCLESYNVNPRIFLSEPKGSAYALLTIKNVLKTHKFILVIWPDAPNIQINTLQKIINLNFKIKSDVIIPTSWEKKPYAGLLRDLSGKVVDIFQSKNSGIYLKYGEHDGNAFLLNTKSFFSSLSEYQTNNTNKDLDLNQVIKFMIKDNKKVIAYCCSSKLEAQGFNTKEEAKKVTNNYFKLLRSRNNTSLKVKFPKFKDNKKSIMTNHKIMFKRFKTNIEIKYKSLAIDIDRNITKKSGELPEKILGFIANLTLNRIFVAFITAKSEISLAKDLLSKISLLDKNNVKLNNIYIYCDNGATGFNLNNPKQYFYKHLIPYYISETAMIFIKKHILGYHDDYKVSASKITLFIRDNKNYLRTIKKIKYLLSLLKLPLDAYVGEINAIHLVVIISLNNGNIIINKGLALKDFSLRTSVELDKVVKIADRGDKFGVDFPMLSGLGSFSTDTYNPDSKYQVDLSAISKKKNLAAFEWLIPKLKFISNTS